MFAIYTTGLAESCKRRMPWRLVLELAKAWNGVVYSAGGGDGADAIDGVRVQYVHRPFEYGFSEAFVERMKADGVSRLYFPIAPGRAYENLCCLCNMAGIELVWYFPGSWNSLSRVWRSWKYLGFRAVKPYLLQALIPKGNWIDRLCRHGVRHLITMTQFTARMMAKNGYPEKFVHPILPGLDSIPKNRTFEHSDIRIISKPYFLFFGPPHAIRGVYLILEAVKKLVDIRTDFEVVMLVRADDNAQAALIKLKNEIGKPVYDGIVHAVYDILSPNQIEGYVRRSVAILKPFVIVPSEVPLAVMEAIQAGKTVIGFEGDGTGELIRNYGISVPHCNSAALAEAMQLCLTRKASVKCTIDEPFNDWHSVAEKWRKLDR